MQERWLPFPHDPRYEISSHGRIKYLCVARWGEFGEGYITDRGYRKFRGKKVHRIVLEAFVGPCPEGKEVNHKDGNKLNNHLENLEYVTHTENMRHVEQNDLRTPWTGARWKTNKVSRDQAEFFVVCKAQGLSNADIEFVFGLPVNTVSCSVRRLGYQYDRQGNCIQTP